MLEVGLVKSRADSSLCSCVRERSDIGLTSSGRSSTHSYSFREGTVLSWHQKRKML